MHTEKQIETENLTLRNKNERRPQMLDFYLTLQNKIPKNFSKHFHENSNFA